MTKIDELNNQIAQLEAEMKQLADEKDMTVKENREEFETKTQRLADLKSAMNIQTMVSKMTTGQIDAALKNHNDGEANSIAKDVFSAVRSMAKTGIVSPEFMGENGGFAIPKSFVNPLFYDVNFAMKADPVIRSTQAGMIRNEVFPELSIVRGDDFSLLQSLGVKFYPNLTGKTAINWSTQATSSKPSEAGDPSTANFAPDTNYLEPVEYSLTQGVSFLTLKNAPDQIIAEWLNDMQLAGQRKIVSDLFSEIILTDTSVGATAGGLTYGDMINLTKIKNSVGLTSSFVTGTDIRVYLEQTPVNSTGISLAWNALNNTVGGRKAIDSDAMAAKNAIFGNWAYAAVGLQGTPEILVTRSASTPGLVTYGAVQYADVAVKNKNAFMHFDADVSCGI